MFYVFQLGTNMLLFTCLYIVEIIVLVTGISIGLSIEEVENVFLFSFPCLLTFGFCFLITSKKNPNETVPKKPVFHPTSTFRKRLANKIYTSLYILSISLLLLVLFWPFLNRELFIAYNLFSISMIIISLIFSLFFEAKPDKNDTIAFKNGNIYYYMRVTKNNKYNKYMNSYIIPLDSIIRSYIIKNDLFIEFDRNHEGDQIHREYTTHSKRIHISFLDYPELRPFVLKKENQLMLKIKQIKDIENSEFK